MDTYLDDMPDPAPTVVAVIPARAGSRGVIDKNLRRVGGTPLIARATQAALAAESISHVYVSTDGAAIAAAARTAGAEVIERPEQLANDTATSESALLHALDEIEARGVRPDVLVFIQATSPFIDPADLDTAVARVVAHEDDVVFSACETHAFLWKIGDNGAEAVNHDASFRPRRQDREPQYLETGAFYVMDVAGFRKAGFRFFGRIGIAATDERNSLEIDTYEQLQLADAIARRETSDPTADTLLTSKGHS